MSPQTIELVLKVLAAAGPIIAQIPTLGAKWIKNRDEVAAMVREGREPTRAEHARLRRELASLTESLGDALATAEAAAEVQAPANEEVEPDLSAAEEAALADEEVDEIIDSLSEETPADEEVEAAVSVAAEVGDSEDEAAPEKEAEGEAVDGG